MRRFYDVKQFRSIVDTFRKRYPLFNFTTDIIVGFPGETDALFQESYNVAKEIGFGHIHTFKYSVRKGTIAEKMNEHIPDKIKVARSEAIRNLAEESKLAYRQQFIDKVQTMLIEKPNTDKGATGYGEHFIPIILDKNHSVEKNTFQKVKLNGIADDKEKSVRGILF